MDIKPIETIYNGYRFRSRLEARWAVFFDSVGIPYEYETEGYVLSDGTMYLPDFYLPWFKAFVEVKRESLYYEEEEIAKRKLEMLFDSTDIDCIGMLCLGDPANKNVNVLCNYSDEEGKGTSWFTGWFYEGAYYKNRSDIDGHDPDIANHDSYNYTKHWITLSCDTPYEAFCMTNHWNDHNIECRARLISCRNRFEDSALAARQARFEHGECGR